MVRTQVSHPALSRKSLLEESLMMTTHMKALWDVQLVDGTSKSFIVFISIAESAYIRS